MDRRGVEDAARWSVALGSMTCKAHQPDQTPNPMTTDTDALPPKVPHHLAAAAEQVLQKQLIDPPHQR